MAAAASRSDVGGANGDGTSAAFFAIYDPLRYPAYDNGAFLCDQPAEAAAQRVPYLRLHLPQAGASAEPPAEIRSDSLDDNAVMEASAAAAAAAAAPDGRRGNNRWAVAAAAAATSAATERRPTLLRLAEAAAQSSRQRGGLYGDSASAVDLSELLVRSFQRQRDEAVQLHQRHEQPLQPLQPPQLPQPHQQQQLSRGPSVRSGAASAEWWRGAIAEHLNSRAGHHYFNGERDPAAVARATIRGSLLAYRRGPRPDVISYHFEHQLSPPGPPPQPQREQETPPMRRVDSMRQSTRL